MTNKKTILFNNKIKTNMPSELIKLSLIDLAEINTNPSNNDIKNCAYYDFSKNVCYATLSSAIITGSLKRHYSKNFFNYPMPLRKNMGVLDALSYCFITGVLRKLNIEENIRLPRFFVVTPYFDDPKQFNIDMFKLIELFQSCDL